MEKKDTYFIIDFDSTFIKFESLDKLAQISLKGKADYKARLDQIKKFTDMGMNGEIPFSVSLEKRIKLFDARKKDIEKLIKILKENITPSIKRNKEFFRKFGEKIYILSGGFAEYIYPVFKSFGLSKGHILANEFEFDKKGKVTGFNKEILLSRAGGKVEQIRKLKLAGDIY